MCTSKRRGRALTYPKRAKIVVKRLARDQLIRGLYQEGITGVASALVDETTNTKNRIISH